TPLGKGIGGLLFIGRAQEASLGSGRDVNAAAPQALGDRPVAVLIEVEPDRPGHQPSFLGASAEARKGELWLSFPWRTALPLGCRRRSGRGAHSSMPRRHEHLTG